MLRKQLRRLFGRTRGRGVAEGGPSNGRLEVATNQCPHCAHRMQREILHTGGIVVVENTYLEGMRDLQAEADAGRAARSHLGHVVAIIPMQPDEQKYAHCLYCDRCKVVVVGRADVISREEVPEVAR